MGGEAWGPTHLQALKVTASWLASLSLGEVPFPWRALGVF